MTAVAYLFVPGHEERKIEKALESGADAVILDLEDSVPESEKAAARCLANQYASVNGRQTEIWIRVNSARGDFIEDLAGIRWPGVAGIIIPKAEDPELVRACTQKGSHRVILLIESIAGIMALPQLVKASPAVERLAIGTWDLALDLALWAADDPDDSELIWQLRGQIVIESRRLGLPPPIDAIYSRLNDENGLMQTCRRAVLLGYGGKFIIHPSQIPIVRAAFRPGSAKLQWAREIVAAYEGAIEQGLGAVQVHGQVIDRPMFEHASHVLACWNDRSSGG